MQRLFVCVQGCTSPSALCVPNRVTHIHQFYPIRHPGNEEIVMSSRHVCKKDELAESNMKIWRDRRKEEKHDRPPTHVSLTLKVFSSKCDSPMGWLN